MTAVVAPVLPLGRGGRLWDCTAVAPLVVMTAAVAVVVRRGGVR